ncbi:MAG: putative endonuclease [Parcubacteria group bacterium Gr01-1014_29]|nr:MAG: putative endonuclease [Parcubacteria group bacterium Gr01-1014_29]
MYSPTRNRGNIAEDLVAAYLESGGYKINARNYLKKWGEIDIVASKYEKIYFIEVKSLFLGAYLMNEFENSGSWKTHVSHETDEFQETASESSNQSVSPSHPGSHSRGEIMKEWKSGREESEGSHTRQGVEGSRETESDSVDTREIFDPVWNMTSKKKKSLSRVINSYISERFRDETPDFQIDLVSVSLDCSKKIGYIKRIENIVLET